MGCTKNGKAVEKRKPRPRLLAFLISLFLAILDLIPSLTYAESDINLQNIPTELAEALGIPTFAGQILISGVVLIMCLLPFSILTRGYRSSANTWIFEATITFVILGGLVAIGWLPYWFLLIVAMFIALMFAGTVRDFITGRGK